MAGFGWNMRQGNTDMYDQKGSTQIACRICDRVFLSTQALINHIETHMVHDETAAAAATGRARSHHHQNDQLNSIMLPPRRNPLLQQPANPNNFQNNNLLIPRPSMSEERYDPSLFQNDLRNYFPIPPGKFTRLTMRYMHGPQLPRNGNFGQESGHQIPQQLPSSSTTDHDFTKPLLDQLQRQQIVDVKRDDEGNNRVYESERLDLNLKL